MLFDLQVFVDFLAVTYLLISSWIPLCSVRRHCMIPSLLNLLSFVLWPTLGFISVVFYLGYCLHGMFHVNLRMSLSCCCQMKQSIDVHYIHPVNWWCLNSAMYLLTFCLLSLFISDTGMLNSPTRKVDLSISPYNSAHIFWYPFVRHIYITDCYVFLKDTLSSLHNAPLDT